MNNNFFKEFFNNYNNPWFQEDINRQDDGLPEINRNLLMEEEEPVNHDLPLQPIYTGTQPEQILTQQPQEIQIPPKIQLIAERLPQLGLRTPTIKKIKHTEITTPVKVTLMPPQNEGSQPPTFEEKYDDNNYAEPSYAGITMEEQRIERELMQLGQLQTQQILEVAEAEQTTPLPKNNEPPNDNNNDLPDEPSSSSDMLDDDSIIFHWDEGGMAGYEVQLPDWIEDPDVQAALSEEFEGIDKSSLEQREQFIKDKIKNIINQMDKKPYLIKLREGITHEIEDMEFLYNEKDSKRKKTNKGKPVESDMSIQNIIQDLTHQDINSLQRRMKIMYGQEVNREVKNKTPELNIRKKVIKEIFPIYSYTSTPILPNWFPKSGPYIPRWANEGGTLLAYFQIMIMCANRNDYWRANAVNPTKWLMFNNRDDWFLDINSIKFTKMPWGKVLLFEISKHEGKDYYRIPENCLWIPLFNGLSGEPQLGCMLYWPNMLTIEDTPNYIEMNKLGIQLITNWLQLTKKNTDRFSYNFTPLYLANNPFYNERYTLYLTGWGKHLAMPKIENYLETKAAYTKLFKNYTYNFITKTLYQIPSTLINAMELKKWDFNMYWSLEYYATIPCVVSNFDVPTSILETKLDLGNITQIYADQMETLSQRLPLKTQFKTDDVNIKILISNLKYNLRIRNMQHITRLLVYGYTSRLYYIRDKIYQADNSNFREMVYETIDDFEQDQADVLAQMSSQTLLDIEDEMELENDN